MYKRQNTHTHTQAALHGIFEVLMQDVERTLNQRNREQFTKNVNQFRREITSHIKSPSRAASLVATNSQQLLSNSAGEMVADHVLLSY